MSAESSLVFYGLRFDVAASDIEQLELRKHPWIVNARSAGLHFYWANFGGLDLRYYFFIGRKIGITGLENSSEIVVNDADLAKQISETKTKLNGAGFDEEPKLFAQFIPG